MAQKTIILLGICLMIMQFNIAQNDKIKSEISAIDKQINLAVGNEDYVKASKLKKKKELYEQMESAVEKEDYSKAAQLKEQIEAFDKDNGIDSGPTKAEKLKEINSQIVDLDKVIKTAVGNEDYENASKLKKKKELYMQMQSAIEKDDKIKVANLSKQIDSLDKGSDVSANQLKSSGETATTIKSTTTNSNSIKEDSKSYANIPSTYSDIDMYELAELPADYLESVIAKKYPYQAKWSRDSIDVSFHSRKPWNYKFKKGVLGEDKYEVKVRVSFEIFNNTGRDLVYDSHQYADLYIAYLSDWEDRLFNLTTDKKAVSLRITKAQIIGTDTIYVFPAKQNWNWLNKSVTLLVPASKVPQNGDYYAQYTSRHFPLTPPEMAVYDREQEKKAAYLAVKEDYLKARFHTPKKIEQGKGEVVLQIDPPLLKKFTVYINGKSVGDLKRGYYKFDFASNQEVEIKFHSKKNTATTYIHKESLKTGFHYFYNLNVHSFTTNDEITEVLGGNIILVNSDFIPQILIDRGIREVSFSLDRSQMITGPSLP